MKFEVDLTDEVAKRISALLALRKILSDSFEKNAEGNQQQLESIAQAIRVGDTEINSLLLKAVYENKEWQV